MRSSRRRVSAAISSSRGRGAAAFLRLSRGGWSTLWIVLSVTFADSAPYGQATEAVARLAREHESRPCDDTVPIANRPSGAGLGFGAAPAECAGLEHGARRRRAGLRGSITRPGDRPARRGAVERDRDFGGLAWLRSRGPDGKLGSKLRAIGRNHVELELAGGEGRDLETAVGIGCRAALARRWRGAHGFLRPCHGDDLQPARRGRIVSLNAAGQPAGGLQCDYPGIAGTRAQVASLTTKAGGFDPNGLAVLGSTAFDFSLAVGVGRGREQIGEAAAGGGNVEDWAEYLRPLAPLPASRVRRATGLPSGPMTRTIVMTGPPSFSRTDPGFAGNADGENASPPSPSFGEYAQSARGK